MMIFIVLVYVIKNVCSSVSPEPGATSTTPSLTSYLFPSEIPYECQKFPVIENGLVQYTFERKLAVITCEQGFDLIGKGTIYCLYGHWNYETVPRCDKKCSQPPSVENGQLSLDDTLQVNGAYQKGTVATYTCNPGYFLDPPTSRMRVCERGIWTGPVASCRSQFGCPPIFSTIANGYLDYDASKNIDNIVGYGQIVSYICSPGYTLEGPKFIKCESDGTWGPKIPSKCKKTYDLEKEDISCDTLPTVPHSTTKVLQQYDTESLVGSVVEISCFGKYRNSLVPCQKSKLKCIEGRWIGTLPSCVPARDCLAPPQVRNALVVDVNYENFYDSASSSKYPIWSKVTYQCNEGYVMDEGSPILTCQSSGCWEPVDLPVCRKTSGEDDYIFAMTNGRSTLMSTAAGVGVLSLLAMFCVVVACRRRRKARGTRPAGPNSNRTSAGVVVPSNDHATLLSRPPDRLALIAFADGVPGSQNNLPTYEEAIRNERNVNGANSNLTVGGRFHRPHWPSLGGRRARNSPNPDAMHIVRHGSFASHTPSTRSAGDSMGSTDTVAVSEGSTNVTLDTASSHSGSQNPSCRVHCGSLASFDACSVINTEDVPLLEENEFDEIQGGNNEVDNPIVSDNTSSKISTNSAPILSS